jgi:hypothetical protein
MTPSRAWWTSKTWAPTASSPWAGGGRLKARLGEDRVVPVAGHGQPAAQWLMLYVDDLLVEAEP